MKENQWSVYHKNLYIRNGEIDRVYCHHDTNKKSLQFCIAEIKTSLLFSQKDFASVFTEVGFKRYLKQRQIQNIYRFGETLHAQLCEKKVPRFHIVLRFFLIFKFIRQFEFSQKMGAHTAIKTCCLKQSHAIFSVEPEFTQICARKSLLQVHV